MTAYLTYVDESYDEKTFCLSALVLKHRHWHASLTALLEHRRSLKSRFGVPTTKEVHAHKFLKGKGKYGDGAIGVARRVMIFAEILDVIAKLPDVFLINVCLPRAGWSRDTHMVAWDRMLNRLERTLSHREETEERRRLALIAIIRDKIDAAHADAVTKRLVAHAPRAIVISDEGREHEIRRAYRRMRRHNPIPSRLGAWSDGSATKNLPLQRIIEDPVFRESGQSYFLQGVDCIVHALLRRESPTASSRASGLSQLFESKVGAICHTACSRRDPLGIVRS